MINTRRRHKFDLLRYCVISQMDQPFCDCDARNWRSLLWLWRKPWRGIYLIEAFPALIINTYILKKFADICVSNYSILLHYQSLALKSLLHYSDFIKNRTYKACKSMYVVTSTEYWMTSHPWYPNMTETTRGNSKIIDKSEGEEIQFTCMYTLVYRIEIMVLAAGD